MSEHCPGTEIENVFIDPKDREKIDEALDATIGKDSGRKYIVMFNSRVHLVADWLRRRGLTGCRVVGFDVLEKNVALMKEGYVQCLIAQHTDRQTVAAVNAMVDFLILGKPVARKDNYTQMDILNIYNCDYYM